MQENAFTEKLYTSTEVAQILGVSLRSIYRYLDENKIQAAVKTATGRHRFTKQNINDFLHPGERTKPSPAPSDVEKPSEEKKPVEKEPPQDETVDWLARFRQAAEKHKTGSPAEEAHTVRKSDVGPSKTAEPAESGGIFVEEKEVEPEGESSYYYYRSGVGGLKEIAQSLDKSAKNASLDYAFTMNAGLSLHKPIKPFSLIHAYIRPGDLAYFEKVLQLTACQKDTAQLCLITSKDEKLYSQRKEMHGLYVVSDDQIKLDLLNEGETELANELD